MKICIHSNQFDGRGTGKTPRDYGLALRDLLGHDVCYLTSQQGSNAGAEVISQNFPVHYYPGYIDRTLAHELRAQIEDFVDREKIDFMHLIKFGIDDGITPRNCRTGIHYVFNGSQPHGNVYAAVSDNLARKFSLSAYVPHIVQRFEPTRNLRRELHIPEDALVVGRHGGRDTFDLPFVRSSVLDLLEIRTDIYFVFLSTDRFVDHPRAIFIDWVRDESDVYNFIHSCDIMLHGRRMGETFGLAVAEFAACSKPVMTWTGPGDWSYDTAHIEQLKGKAILYREDRDIIATLSMLTRSDAEAIGFDTITKDFSPQAVINQYRTTFL